MLVVGRRAELIASVILVACFGLFLSSPIRDLSDAKYALLLSESLLRGRGMALEDFLQESDSRAVPYQLQRIEGHIFYAFPPGTSLISVPFLATLKLLGVRVVGPDGKYFEEGEWVAQGVLAALFSAASSCLFFLIACQFLEDGPASLIALVGALGTPVWSVARNGAPRPCCGFQSGTSPWASRVKA